MRKGLIYWLAILMAVLPLLGSFSKEVAAASTRVAVIKELKGTVKVKKAGGSKEFTAFAKMSLNEGDVLAVGSGGSAVLQFANGTSEDDKMTVASNAKLTFSKLSNKKGTTTKVSMWSGTAWVDVKSITNKEDQFTLETPTAVMGVRGTHLLVAVNPNTGATNLMVAAGVVQTTSTAGGGQSQNVYPTQNALITKDGEDGSDVTIAPADLETLMQQGDAEIVKAIIQGAKDITAENEQYVQRYENGEVPKEIGGTNADLERFKNNTQNLLGALVTQAVETGLITQERMNQLIEEAGNQTGFKVDLTKSSLQLTEAEKAKQEVQRKKEEALAKREAERKAKEESERKKLEDTIRKLEEERKAKEKAAQEAAEAKKKQAQEKYESQLSEAEKNRLRADANRRQEETKAAQSSASPSPSVSPTPSPTPSQVPVLSGNANLSGLIVRLPDSNANMIPFGQPNLPDNTYTITVPNTTGKVIVKPTLADAHATVKIAGGQSITSGNEVTIPLVSSGGSVSTTSITLVVTAENGTTKPYTIVVTRQASILNSSVWIPGIELFNPEQAVYNLDSVPSDTEQLPLDFGSQVTNRDIVVTNNGVQVERSEGLKDRFDVPLVAGANKIEISVTSYIANTVASLADFSILGVIQPGAPITQTYTINVTRRAQASTTDILSFSIGESQVNDTIIDYEQHYVFIEVPKGSSLLLPANFELSPGAVAYTWNGVNDWNERASGEYQSFDGPVVYRISAEDGMFTDWLVYVHYPSEVHGIQIAYGDGEYLSAVPVGDFEYVAHVHADIGTNRLHLYPYGIYFMTNVYQLVDGDRVWLENGADLPVDEVTGNIVEGWYDFIFSVDEGGGETIELELHVWVGDDMPEPFMGFNVVTDSQVQSGAAYYDSDSLFVELAEYEGNIRFRPSLLPEDVQLDAMLLTSYDDTLEVLQLNNGYYSIGTERLGNRMIAVLSSEGRKWAYQVQFIPEYDPELYGIAFFAMANGEYFQIGAIDIDESGSGSFNVLEEYLSQDIYVLPQFVNHTYGTKVAINGETLPSSEELKYRVAEFSGAMTIPISLTSPSGKFSHQYTIDLGVAESGPSAPPQLGLVKIYNMNNGDSLPIEIDDLMNAIYDPIYLSPPNPPTMNLGLELAPVGNGQSIEVFQGDEQIFPTNGKYPFSYSGSNVTLTINVTSAEGDDSKGYTLVVSPYSITNAGITNLKVGDYYVLYSAATGWDYYYVIPEVEGGQQQFALNDLTFGIASNASATVKLNGSTDGVTYDEQQFNYDFVLNNVDSNLISIEVTAETGNKETYNLYVVKNHSPHNLVLDNINLSTQSGAYGSGGFYSNITKSYWYSPNGNLAKEVESITIEPEYGNGSEGVHSKVYAEDGTELTADGNGKFGATGLHFGHNSFTIDVYEPENKYYQEYLYNVWRDGIIEVWDADGMDLLASNSYAASNNIELTIPFDTTRLTFKTVLNSPAATIIAKYKVGENEYVEFSDFGDGSYSSEFLFDQSTDTIVLEIHQPNTQYYTYTIHLVRAEQ